MKMYVNDCYFQELVLLDAAGEVIAECKWYDHDKYGEWQEFEIPEGQEIIGLQVNTSEYYIHSMGLVTWNPNLDAVPADPHKEEKLYK